MSTRTDTVRANGIDIAFDAFGDDADPALLLVMGLGGQRIGWTDDICEHFADAGRYVVRFDNRDVGESTHFPELGRPSLFDIVRGRVPYRLEDMANDLIGLLDALSLDAADVVGVSLGGFIAQTAAILHPQRVRSLTLIMTSTGSRRVGRASLPVLLQMLRLRPVRSRAEAADLAVMVSKVIGSPGYPLDEERVRSLAGIAYDRGHDPGGFRRQMAAGLSQRDRTEDLRRLDIPTLVIHGLADPLVSVTGGLATAASIPAAKFIGYAGMGHDIPVPLRTTIADEILKHSGGRAA